MKKQSKIFVIDTNVILHDFNCIYHFEENNVIIPIVVLEELDKLKKGNEQINFNAREFTRELDKISGDKLFNGGISLGKDKGKLSIETGKLFSDELRNSFPETTPDHRILAITEYLKEKNTTTEVILITKDINLRMKAKSLGILAQDYKTDKVANLELLHKNIEVLNNISNELISRLYEFHEGIDIKEFNIKAFANQYFILRGQDSSTLAYFNPFENTMHSIIKHKAFGIDPRNAEQTFSLHALTNPNIQLVALTGKAGTGKTLLALAAALEQKEQFNQILLARPIVPLANRDMGFLPGDVQEKITPYMQPLFDNLSVIKHQYKSHSNEYRSIDEMLDTEKLVLSPLAYIRGRSLSNSFFIVDEAQNLTPHEIKTIITRAGEGTKIIFTGDIHQIDSPYLDIKSNGLSYLTDKLKGQDIFAHINLVKGERSYLAELASDLL